MTKNDETSYTLLERALNLNDDAAWEEVMEKYKSFVYFILRERGIPESDMDDIVQVIVSELATRLHTFDKSKGKFRSWFAQIIKNKAIHYYRRSGSYNRKLDRYKSLVIDIGSAEDTKFQDQIETEWLNYLAQLAMDRVSLSYRTSVIDVFKASLNGNSTSKIALEYGITEQTVYTYRTRVKQSLKLEMQRIMTDLQGCGV